MPRRARARALLSSAPPPRRPPVPRRRSIWIGLLAVLALGLSCGSASATGSGPSPEGFDFSKIDPGSFPNLSAVSCTTTRLCVAVDGRGNVLSSPDPSRVAWSIASVGGPDAVSCTMSGLCAVVGNGGEVDVSTDPTGGVSAWSARKISHTDLTDVSCPSNRLCVAVDYRGNVLASAHPLGAASTWHRTLLTSSAYDLQSVSCPTVSFCVASGYHDGESIYGDVSVSHHPTGGRRAWSTFRLHTHEATGLGVSCPSPKLCVAEGGAEFLTSTNPAGGPVAWRDTYLGGQGQPGSASGGPLDLVALSCASTRLCVAIDISGYAFTSIEPTAGRRAWVRTRSPRPSSTVSS
ncbi:MAG: hypothetical protein M3Y17_06065 [Actinomycetota bacterium]|nr:hypothetical protein [Actinomycetota bacterium]